MMTQDEKKWLLQLSALSLIGPMSHSGTALPIAQKAMLNYFDITDGQSYLQAVMTLRDGSLFSRHMYHLLWLGKMMDIEARQIERAFHIEAHSYSYEVFTKLMAYELHWTKKVMEIGDLTNGIELIKLGVSGGFISEESHQNILESYFHEVKERFESYKSFGIAATMCRELRLCHMQQKELSSKIIDMQHVLAIAYYGVWEQK